MATIKADVDADDIVDAVMDTDGFSTEEQVDLVIKLLEHLGHWFAEVEHRDEFHKGFGDDNAAVELAHRARLRNAASRLLKEGRRP